MTIFKVTIKSSFFVEADSIFEASATINEVISDLPNANVNIKVTKKKSLGEDIK